MKLSMKLLLVVPLLYVVTITNTTMGGVIDEENFLHEVAHPRACILKDNDGNAKAAAENFAHGHWNGSELEMDLFVTTGTTVYFKSGFGYEGVWFEGVTGTLSTKIEVSMDGVPVDTKEHTKTTSGPHIERDSVSVPITFDEYGEFAVESILTTTVLDDTGNPLAEDVDTVVTHVQVADEKEITLLQPEDDAVLPPDTRPDFAWSSYGFKRFQLQFSTSSDFDRAENLLKMPPFGFTKKTSVTLRKRIWKILKNWEEENGGLYWRVLGKAKHGEEGESETRQFSIE